MDSIEAGIVIEVIELQLLNTRAPITFTSEGIIVELQPAIKVLEDFSMIALLPSGDS